MLSGMKKSQWLCETNGLNEDMNWSCSGQTYSNVSLSKEVNIVYQQMHGFLDSLE